MSKHPIVSHDEWLAARQRFLAKEKQFTRLRDELSRERQALPWERVDKDYVFESDAGRQTLAQLFGARSQLIVYHFMFAPDWELGCKSCSFWADNFNGIVPHLHARDVSMVAVARARRILRPRSTLFGRTRAFITTPTTRWVAGFVPASPSCASWAQSGVAP